MKSEILKLQNQMSKAGVDIYVVLTSDFHASEYIAEYFREIPYLTGFTGSAATLVVTQSDAYMWTDGRYFLQAASQLKDSGIILQRMGEKDVPTVTEFIEDFFKGALDKGVTLGLDARLVNAHVYAQYEELAQKYNAKISDGNLVDAIFDRPALPANPVWIFKPEYSGVPFSEKLARVRESMTKREAAYYIISDLCQLAWLFNLRGSDIEHVPVFYGFAVIGMDSCDLYVQDRALSDEVRAYLSDNEIGVLPYFDIYTDDIFSRQDPKPVCLCDLRSLNARLHSALSSYVTFDDYSPCEELKAVKNKTEIENCRRAHIDDAIAMIRFMKYLKDECYGREDLNHTEISLSDMLYDYRAMSADFLDISFDTISAYGPNGAIVHYEADNDSDSKIYGRGLYLVDSGGHYLTGTTDITRTFAMGPLTDDMRTKYTLVLKANLHLANAVFLKGCCGENLDVLARGPIWDRHLDYKHGTGHGVGHVLSVHEGPNGFRYKLKDDPDCFVLDEGMITTDEPGIYIEGEFGIRLENELLCVKRDENEYGTYLGFECLTYVPFDREAIDYDMLTPQEIEWLNDYHAMIVDTLRDYLDDDLLEWLIDYCKPYVV